MFGGTWFPYTLGAAMSNHSDHTPWYLLAGLLVLSLFIPPRQQGKNKFPATAKPFPVGDPPNIVVNNPIPQTRVEKSTDKVPVWKDRHFIIQCLILLATLVIARIYYCQLLAMTRNNELSRDALYSVQRAFIIPAKPTTEIDEYDTVNGMRRQKPLKLLEFTYRWENVGNTPAVGLVTAVGKVVQTDELTEQEFITTLVDKFTAKSALGPKATLDSGTLRDDETFLTDQPGVPRFMWGWIVYRDVFPNIKTHVTEWCWKIDTSNGVRWKLDESGKRSGTPQITATACTHHNCVDEFCEDYGNIRGLSPAN